MISQKIRKTRVSFVGASGRTPMIGPAPLAPTCKALKNRVASPLGGRNAKVAAQSRSERNRWTFYGTISTLFLNYTTRCVKKIQTGEKQKSRK